MCDLQLLNLWQTMVFKTLLYLIKAKLGRYLIAENTSGGVCMCSWSLMAAAGFTLSGQGHPIIPVMIGEAAQATALAKQLFDRGVYVTAFSYPGVPHGTARIRTQMNAAHTSTDIDHVVAAFIDAAHHLEILAPTA